MCKKSNKIDQKWPIWPNWCSVPVCRHLLPFFWVLKFFYLVPPEWVDLAASVARSLAANDNQIKHLSTSCLIFPSFPPDPTIFDKGIFLIYWPKKRAINHCMHLLPPSASPRECKLRAYNSCPVNLSKPLKPSALATAHFDQIVWIRSS